MYTTNPCTTPILTDTACELGPTVFSAMVEALAKLRCTDDPAFLANIFWKEREPVIFDPASVVLAMPWLLLPPVIPLMAYTGVSCIDTLVTANTPTIKINAIILVKTLLLLLVLIIGTFSNSLRS